MAHGSIIADCHSFLVIRFGFRLRNFFVEAVQSDSPATFVRLAHAVNRINSFFQFALVQAGIFVDAVALTFGSRGCARKVVTRCYQ